jgi:hypothetical protein
MTFGMEADISNLCQFGWYEWVYFREDSASFPFQKERLGRCLGPAKNEGNAMTQRVLKDNGKVVPRRTIRRLSTAELSLTNETEAERRMQFTTSVRGILGDSISLPAAPPPNPMDGYWELEPYGDDIELPLAFLEADIVNAAGKPIMAHSLTDTLINAEVLLPLEDSQAIARVVRRMVNSEGKLIGEHNNNPLLNTLVYECEFNDGTTREYAANTIASNIFMESDADGFASSFLYHIVDHKSSGEAIKMADKYITTKSGTRHLRQTTVGWKLLVEWANSSCQWIDLKLLKESNPVQVAEDATARNIADEPAFAWWVPYVLRKHQDVVVSAVNSWVKRTSHKYGIEVPTSKKHAIEVNQKNKNSFWADALKKEMGNVCVTFEILGQNAKAPPGWFKASGHIVFDVKMNFTQKARWVKEGHKTPDSKTCFAGVVSRDSIRIALTHAALLDLPVMGADIRNAYLQAPSSEKHFIICGHEFGI